MSKSRRIAIHEPSSREQRSEGQRCADIKDRDGGVLLMATVFSLHPFLRKLHADGGYQGPQFQAGLRRVARQIEVEIVKRSDAAKGFTVLHKRWIVERTIA